MSGFVQAGACPKCGAPIYVPQVWHAITPPPASYSCACVGSSLAGRLRAVTPTNDNPTPEGRS